MVTKISGNRIVFPNKIGKGDFYIENGKIIAVNKDLPFDAKCDFGNDYVFSGLIDIHTHGAAGFDFADADTDGILNAVKYHLSHGATSIMPTVTSSSYEKTYGALLNIESAMQDKDYGKRIIGVHLEGPYFSEKQCGAQDKTFITAPVKKDYERLIARFGKIIKRWDYAPERDVGGEFCKYLTEHGILPAAGHTDAKYEDMLIAKENGCKLVTHLYSCTSGITREQGFRKLGVIECAYLWDDTYVEIIADGKHLPPELLKLIFKLKTNDKIILVSDSLRVTGSGEKYSSVGTVKCVIEDGVCKLLDRSAFAGSIATADRLIKESVGAGLSVKKAIKMGSENPAKLFDLSKGKIQEGYDADIVVTDKDFNVKTVFAEGEKALCC